MCLAQDNQRKADTAAGFGSEMQENSVAGKALMSSNEKCICVYICLKTQKTNALEKLMCLESFE